MIKKLKGLIYDLGLVSRLSKRRLHFIDHLLDGWLLSNERPSLRVLEVGCQTGKDAVKLLKDRQDVGLVGLDMEDYGLRQDNFQMVLGDAERLPFPDAHFDLTLSIGLLEHVAPIEKLSRAVAEIDRVSRSYVVVVPSVGSVLEPHLVSPLWHLRDRTKKRAFPEPLIYMSDDAWMAFEGFQGAQSRRFSHIPFLVSNLVIFKRRL